MAYSRMRAAAVAGSMALTLSLAAAPVVTAQDDPAATIQNFMDAVAAKDFEALPTFFCEAEAGQAAQFDVSALAGEMPPGMDVQSLLDAFIFDIQLDELEVISQTESEAVVSVAGSMAMDIDAEALVPFIEAVIEMSGMEADESTIEMFTGLMMSEFEAQSEDLDGEVTLVPGEEMAWVICSDLDFGSDEVVDESMDATDGSMDESAEATDGSMDDSADGVMDDESEDE